VVDPKASRNRGIGQTGRDHSTHNNHVIGAQLCMAVPRSSLFAISATSAFHHILRVVDMITKLKMKRVHTAGVIALMANKDA